MLDPEGARSLEEPVHRAAIETAGLTAQAVRLGDACEQLQVDLMREPPECAVADLIANLEPRSWLQVLRHDTKDLPAHVVAVH